MTLKKPNLDIEILLKRSKNALFCHTIDFLFSPPQILGMTESSL